MCIYIYIYNGEKDEIGNNVIEKGALTLKERQNCLYNDHR